MDILKASRKSFLEIGKIYFWTATIRDWNLLLSNDSFKEVIVSSLWYLKKHQLVDIYGFVIMPNHIHLIWKLHRQNGNELPSASFTKFTAHQFKKMLSTEELLKYSVQAPNKTFEFWQRDALAIELYTDKVAYQKLDYIHSNPLQERWNLVKHPEDYHYSSARFYENESSSFPFLTHLGEVF